jgi:hypothetical protein
LLQCQRGLGDNIFTRPLIRAAAATRDVWLDTPWPELFEDLPVFFAPAETKLRTQEKNVRRQDVNRWGTPPEQRVTLRLAYGHAALRAHGTIMRALESLLPTNGAPFVFDLPDIGPPPLSDRKIALIRPVTVRREWANPARNPIPSYVNDIAAALMETHCVVVVADLQDDEEWLLCDLPTLRNLNPLSY